MGYRSLVYDPSVAASGDIGASIGSEGSFGEIVYNPMSHPHFLDSGMGQDVGVSGLTVDQIAQRTMHDLAVRIFAAKTAGNVEVEQALRLELARVSAIFRGFATEAEKRAVAEEAAGFDPLGVKAIATAARTAAQGMSLAAVAALAGLAFLAFPRKR